MKRLLLTIVIAAALAGCKTTAQNDDKTLQDIKPAAAAKTDAPTSAEWQSQHRAEIDRATKGEVLAGYVRSRAAADGLVAEVKPDYSGDALKLVQFAAVSQYVMTRNHDAERRIWTAALVAGIGKSSDTLVKTLLLDQLRWCGYREQATEVKALGAASADQHVREMCALVSAELATSNR